MSAASTQSCKIALHHQHWFLRDNHLVWNAWIRALRPSYSVWTMMRKGWRHLL